MNRAKKNINLTLFTNNLRGIITLKYLIKRRVKINNIIISKKNLNFKIINFLESKKINYTLITNIKDQRVLKILQEYYKKDKLNQGRRKMAKIPAGCELILNPLTGAPGFKLKNVYVLPGVPEIMHKMFTTIIPKLKKSKPKKVLTIKTDLFESVISNYLSKIQKENSYCEIGSYPYFDHKSKTSGVNLVISSWEKDDLSFVKEKIIEMISLLGGKNFIV